MRLYLFAGLNTSDHTVIRIANEVGEYPSSIRKASLKVLLYVKHHPADWLCIFERISGELEISLLALQIGTLPVLEI